MEQERFEELRFYKSAVMLLKAVYLVAGKLPDYEKYNLASQLRRAALSTTLNIAEGYGRYHFPDRLRFFYYARGSLLETLSGFIAAHAVGYIDDKQLAWVRQTTTKAAADLNGYINFIQTQKQGTETFGDKYIREPEVVYEIHPESSAFPVPDSPFSDSPIPASPVPDFPIPDFPFPDSDTGEDK